MDATPTIDSGSTAWMLVSSALVLLMVPGLALFYGGMVRRKNVLSTMMHSFLAMAVIGVQWVVIGYGLAFGDSQGGLVGWGPVAGRPDRPRSHDDVRRQAHPRAGVRDVPGQVRDHHAGLDLGGAG
jgi:hypothetical protein